MLSKVLVVIALIVISTVYPVEGFCAPKNRAIQQMLRKAAPLTDAKLIRDVIAGRCSSLTLFKEAADSGGMIGRYNIDNFWFLRNDQGGIDRVDAQHRVRVQDRFKLADDEEKLSQWVEGLRAQLPQASSLFILLQFHPASASVMLYFEGAFVGYGLPIDASNFKAICNRGQR